MGRFVPFLLLLTLVLLIILVVYWSWGPRQALEKLGNSNVTLNLNGGDLSKVLVVSKTAATTTHNMPTVKNLIDYFNLNTGDSIRFVIINNSDNNKSLVFNGGTSNDSYVNDGLPNGGVFTIGGGGNAESYSFTLTVLGTYKDKGYWGFNTGFPTSTPSDYANTVSVVAKRLYQKD